MERMSTTGESGIRMEYCAADGCSGISNLKSILKIRI